MALLREQHYAAEGYAVALLAALRTGPSLLRMRSLIVPLGQEEACLTAAVTAPGVLMKYYRYVGRRAGVLDAAKHDVSAI